MEKIKPGDKVKVIRDTCGHGVGIGTILTVRDIILHPSHGQIIQVTQTTSFFKYEDVIKQESRKNEKNKFVIIDPSFIMNRRLYKEIQKNGEKDKNSDFEHQKFPIKTHFEEFEFNKQGKVEIIIHIIEKTPYGPGEYQDQNTNIYCESGMLCIAEDVSNWGKIETGKHYPTLKEAQDDFQNVLKKF